MFEFRLLRHRIETRKGQRIDSETIPAAQEPAAPVHWQEGLTRAHVVAGCCGDQNLPPPRSDLDQIAVAQIAARQVARMHHDRRLRHVAEQLREHPGAAHPMPLVAQPPRRQPERIPRIGSFGDRLVQRDGEPRAAIGRRIDTVFVQPRPANARAFGQRPLLRSLRIEHRVAQPGDVEVASARGFAMLIEDLARRCVREERGLARTQLRFQPPREVDRDPPVRPRFAGRGDRRMNMRDPPLGIGDRPLLFGPGRGR